VFKFWQLLTGQFAPYNKKKYGKVLSIYSNPRQMAESIVRRTYKMICINDVNAIDFEKSKRLAHEAFSQALPEKSLFEK